MSAVWQRLPERSIKARTSNIAVKRIPNSLNPLEAALFLTAFHYWRPFLLWKMGATLRAGVFLLLVELILMPGHGARQVTDKMHASSKKCPQATKNGKYT